MDFFQYREAHVFMGNKWHINISGNFGTTINTVIRIGLLILTVSIPVAVFLNMGSLTERFLGICTSFFILHFVLFWSNPIMQSNNRTGEIFRRAKP